MSITYKLENGAPAAPHIVVSAIVEAGAGEAAGAVEAHDGTRGRLCGGGWFDVDVAEYDPPDPVENRFGFAPMVEVHFGLAKFGDLEAQETDILRLALGVLARVPGDALLHCGHDEVWLLRRGGRLTVNETLWRPRQLALLRSQPYEPGSPAFD